jgi:hypothetical protein
MDVHDVLLPQREARDGLPRIVQEVPPVLGSDVHVGRALVHAVGGAQEGAALPRGKEEKPPSPAHGIPGRVPARAHPDRRAHPRPGEDDVHAQGEPREIGERVQAPHPGAGDLQHRLSRDRHRASRLEVHGLDPGRPSPLRAQRRRLQVRAHLGAARGGGEDELQGEALRVDDLGVVPEGPPIEESPVPRPCGGCRARGGRSPPRDVRPSRPARRRARARRGRRGGSRPGRRRWGPPPGGGARGAGPGAAGARAPGRTCGRAAGPHAAGSAGHRG